MLNVNLLEAYVKELQHHTTKHESYTLTFYDLLKLHTDVLTVSSVFVLHTIKPLLHRY